MKKLLVILLILVVGGLLNTSTSVFGQNGSSVDDEIKALNDKIAAQKKQMDNIAERQKNYQAAIEQKRQDQDNLKNQLSILENRAAKAALDIDSTNLSIDKTNLEIKKIQLDMENVDSEIETEMQHIGNLLRIAYKQDRVSTMEMLLLNDSLAEFLNQAKYLANTNDKIKESLDNLQNQKDQLDKSRLSLDVKNKDLVALKTTLETKKDNLDYEQQSKGIILEETKSSEAEYQNLLARAKKEQLQAEAEVYNLEKMMRQKMADKDKVKLENWFQRYRLASFRQNNYDRFS